MKHLILALALILPLSVGAFKPEDLKKLKKTNECRECDLSRANLKGADLVGAKLYGANLKGAKLQEANLEEANLENAKLQGANLPGANLYEASLSGAKLYEADLEYAKDGAFLRSAIFCKTIMPDGSVNNSDC